MSNAIIISVKIKIHTEYWEQTKTREKYLVLHCNILCTSVIVAINLMRDELGIDYLKQYFAEYIILAKQLQYGLILENPTWRASSDWTVEIGVTVPLLIRHNKKSIDFLKTIKPKYASNDAPLIISGGIGPRCNLHCACDQCV